MTTEKKIKAGEIAKDLGLGLSDAELMEKYKLSLKGLLSGSNIRDKEIEASKKSLFKAGA